MTSAIFATGMRCAESSTICARRHVHRPAAPADDPQQALPLVVIDPADTYSLSHQHSFPAARCRRV
ncbi:MAG TPA: hypothetical protein VK401_11860, partial [Propionibacteriaceae bacterium]|nr:hypothetical protein [Propionibacteriaceae bacterium]